MTRLWNLEVIVLIVVTNLVLPLRTVRVEEVGPSGLNGGSEQKDVHAVRLFDAGGLGGVHTNATKFNNRYCSILGDAAKTKRKRMLGGYGMKSMRHLTTWFWCALPGKGGPPVMQITFIVIAVLLCPLPSALYLAFVWLMRKQSRSPISTMFYNAAWMPLPSLLFFSGIYFAIGVLISGVDREFPFLSDLRSLMGIFMALLLAAIPIRFLGRVDYLLEGLATDRITSPSFQDRRDFMNAIKYGHHVVGPTEHEDDQGYYVFRYVWRPFHAFSIVVICTVCLTYCVGGSMHGYPMVIFLGYILWTLILTIFGGRSLGPQVYGGIVLLMEKPFQEGDIVTVDGKYGGGASTNIERSAVTGFVERIGIGPQPSAALICVACRCPTTCLWKIPWQTGTHGRES